MRTLLMVLLLASGSASATSTYFRTGIGLGFGLYTYPTSVQAGRSASGVLANYSLDVGAMFSSGVFLGGTASFDPILAITGISPSGTVRTTLITPGGGFGPMVGFTKDKLLFSLAVMFGGGGAASIAGGFGVYVVPFVGFTFLKREKLHVMATARPLFGYLFDTQAGGTVIFAGGTGGISVAWM